MLPVCRNAPERESDWMEIAMALGFAQYATDFTAEIKELGPNPLKLAKNKAA